MANIHIFEGERNSQRRSDRLARVVAICMLPFALPLLAVSFLLLLLSIPSVWSAANVLALAFGKNTFGFSINISREDDA